MRNRFSLSNASGNMNLEVHAELPLGVTEHTDRLSINREAWGWTMDGNFHQFHFCSHCNGWIAGLPAGEKVHDLGMLSGRAGTIYHCLRCSEEVGFFGAVG